MSTDTSLWEFFFPSEIWTTIWDFVSPQIGIASILGTILLIVYVVLLYGNVTKDMPGAWNPWVIFWAVVMMVLLFLIVGYMLSPVKLFGVELISASPNSCVGINSSMEGGLCYQNCNPGYHGVANRCYADSVNIGVGTPLGLEPCPDDDGDGTHWENLGMICIRWKDKCVHWGVEGIATWWTGCAQSKGRLDNGGQCPGPMDFANNFGGIDGDIAGDIHKLEDFLLQGNYNNEYKTWKKAYDKQDPANGETEAEAAATGHKTCADIAVTTPDDKHVDRIDGLCYKKCPADKPNHIPGMPYLCYKGGDLSYDRGVGMIPPLFRVFNKYGIGQL
jgi:hypothetical protein